MSKSSPGELRIDHHRRILQVMLYLDTHFSRVVSVEKLANMACFSPYHFQRIFLAFTGETVGQYQNRRRLERAIQLLIENQMSILDIAFEVGYESHAGLSKLIDRWLGETPTSIRKNFNPAKLDSFQPVIPPRLPTGQKITPSFQNLPECIFIFIEVHGFENGNFIKACTPAYKEMIHWTSQCQMNEQILFWMGMMPFRPRSYQDPSAPFWFGVALTELPKIPAHFSQFVLPAGQFAVIEHRGPFNYLLQTYNTIFHGWLPESGYTLRDMPSFERYLTNPENTSPENLITEICLPISSR